MFCACLLERIPWCSSRKKQHQQQQQQEAHNDAKAVECKKEVLNKVLLTAPQGKSVNLPKLNGDTGKREYTFKILVLGARGTGKTSFIKRYVHRYYSKNYRPTNGVDFTLKNINWNKRTLVRLQLWDVSGEDVGGGLDAVSPHVYEGCVGALVLYDITSSDSAAAASLQMALSYKRQLDNKVRLATGQRVPSLLLAHKCDDGGRRVADVEATRRVSRDNGFLAWFECSSRDNIHVKDTVTFLARHVLEEQLQIEQMVPVAGGGGSVTAPYLSTAALLHMEEERSATIPSRSPHPAAAAHTRRRPSLRNVYGVSGGSTLGAQAGTPGVHTGVNRTPGRQILDVSEWQCVDLIGGGAPPQQRHIPAPVMIHTAPDDGLNITGVGSGNAFLDPPETLEVKGSEGDGVEEVVRIEGVTAVVDEGTRGEGVGGGDSSEDDSGMDTASVHSNSCSSTITAASGGGGQNVDNTASSSLHVETSSSSPPVEG